MSDKWPSVTTKEQLVLVLSNFRRRSGFERVFPTELESLVSRNYLYFGISLYNNVVFDMSETKKGIQHEYNL